MTPQPAAAWLTDGVRRTLTALDALFAELELPYVATGGTLLGAIRGGDVIPWDDDGDLLMRAQDAERFCAHAEAFLHPHGIHVFRRRDGFMKIWRLDGLRTGAYNAPFVDLYPMVLEDDAWRLESSFERAQWPHEVWAPETFDTRVRRALGEGSISTATDAIATGYIERHYGADWRTPAYWGLHSTDRSVRVPDEPGAPKPRRRTDHEVHTVPGEVIIYQRNPRRAHHLNHTATLVYALAGGELTAGGISAHLAHVFGLETPPTADVEACVRALIDAEVLDG